MKIAVSGGRDYGNTKDEYKAVFYALNHAVKVMREKMGNKEGIRLIHGGARGADWVAVKWAEYWIRLHPNDDVEVAVIEADWKRYGKSAGPRRNALIAQQQPDIWVIFPGGRGTKNARDLAVAAQIQIMDADPEHPMSQRPKGLV